LKNKGENVITQKKNGTKNKKNCEKTTKITIVLTLNQAHVLLDCLEEYSRIGMAQLSWIEYRLSLDTYDKTLHRPKYDQELARKYLEQAKQTIFTGISSSAYIGIKNTSERSKISWDIYQQLRHDISHWKFPDEPLESRGNAFNKPFVVSKEPLPKVIITDDEV
jgi:hypothetical protein